MFVIVKDVTFITQTFRVFCVLFGALHFIQTYCFLIPSSHCVSRVFAVPPQNMHN